MLAHLTDGLVDLDDAHAMSHGTSVNGTSVAAGGGNSVGHPARTA